MATLSIINTFDLNTQGVDITGKQGLAASADTDVYAITINGTCIRVVDSLATATVRVVFDSSVDFPTTLTYGFYWADQITYLQIIGSATNAVFKIAPYVPYTISGYGSILAAAATTAITGGAEPAVTAIGKIVVGNYSGLTVNYMMALIS